MAPPSDINDDHAARTVELADAQVRAAVIHIKLKKICSRLPWSHDALRTVHQRPYPTTGTDP